MTLKKGSHDMEDKIFHQYLYEEKLKHKEQRFTLITTKIIFVASLFGLSSVSFAHSLGRMHYLLILVPVLCFSTDIYIKAEDYKVKRIGKFLRTILGSTDNQRPQELMWEEFLEKEIALPETVENRVLKKETMREMDSRKNSTLVTRVFCISGLCLFILFSGTFAWIIGDPKVSHNLITSIADGSFLLLYLIEMFFLERWNTKCENNIKSKLEYGERVKMYYEKKK
jgi:hypothetical protein